MSLSLIAVHLPAVSSATRPLYFSILADPDPVGSGIYCHDPVIPFYAPSLGLSYLRMHQISGWLYIRPDNTAGYDDHISCRICTNKISYVTAFSVNANIMRDIYYKETKCLRENCLFYIGTGIRYRKYRESSARALA